MKSASCNQNNQQHQQQRQQQPYIALFHFADSLDASLMIIGSFSAVLNGVVYTMYSLLWGQMFAVFGFTRSNQQLRAGVFKIFMQFVYLGILSIITSWGMIATWTYSGQRQSNKCSRQYLKALLKQDIGWYDCRNQNQIHLQFEQDTNQFKAGIGQKIPVLISVISMLFTAIGMSFYYGWQLALVICSCIPLMGVFAYLFSILVQKKEERLEKNFQNATTKAKQVLDSIKTVKMLNSEEYQLNKYTDMISFVNKNAIKYSIFSSIGTSGIFFSYFLSYAIGYWYSAQLLQSNKSYTVSSVLIIFYAIILTCEHLNKIEPCISKIIQGKSAISRIFQILKQETLTQDEQAGIIPDQFQGEIQFINVTFSYPKNPECIVLNNVSFVLKAGKKYALAGISGSGKSTIFQLLLRYYDPCQGCITLDGNDIRKLNLNWLRKSIGYVGQQPVLFSTTIKQNILFGNPEATDKQISQALEKANAIQFVNKLPQNVNTYVGNCGNHLSGGQKQRIAIARAILKNPKIYLFDEATSALDKQNESQIQQALDNVSLNKTSFTIAHRMSTIKNSDKIIVLQHGHVIQQGNYSQITYFKKNMGLIQQNTYHQTQTKDQVVNELITQQQAELEQYQSDQVLSKMFSYNKQDTCLYLVTLLITIILSGVYPYFSILISTNLETYISLQNNRIPNESITTTTIKWFVLSLWIGLGLLFFTGILNVISQNLFMRVRIDLFKKMLRMPIPWFDQKRNLPTALTHLLHQQCSALNGMTSNYFAVILVDVLCIILSTAIGFYYQWRITLISLIFMPFIVLGGIIQSIYSIKINEQNNQQYRQSSNLISEALTHIRTVYSFTAQTQIKDKFSSMLLEPELQIKRQCHRNGILLGLAVFMINVTSGFLMYVGAVLIEQYHLPYMDVIYARNAVVCMAYMFGMSSAIMPNMHDATKAANKILKVLDDKDELQMQQNSPKIQTISQTECQIQFVNVQFAYGDNTILQQVSFKVSNRQKIALFGPSGCGKSTIVQLLLRFYQPQKGQILLNGIPLKNYDLKFLRNIFGVVNQEPTLFNETILTNLRYCDPALTIEQIIDCLKLVNADFVLGYSVDETIENLNQQVGLRGSHLSGGQRQRIAIARTLLRQPRVLLLDEATSALDRQNQRIVEQTIQKMGKPCIVISHDLQSSRRCDRIYEIQNKRSTVLAK